MEKVLKFVFLIIFSFVLLPIHASGKGNDYNYSSSEISWKPVIEAIIQVESEGNNSAKRGASVGAMQITPLMVAECNNILKSRKIKKRFTLSDRKNRKKSIEMFLLFQSKFNPKKDVELAIRSWNGGMHYTVKRTQRYYEKVMRILRSK